MSEEPGDDIWGEQAAVDPRPGDPVAELLVVCTANICRSPLAEAMLARAAEERQGPDAPVAVSSSGVHGLAGEPAAPLSAEEAVRRGLDLDRHVARPAEPEDVADPYGGPRAGYVDTADELDALVAVIAPQLFGWRPHDPR